MPFMFPAGGDPFAAVVLALRGAGMEPQVGAGRAVCVPMPDNAYAIVAVRGGEPAGPAGTWPAAPTPPATWAYELSFHDTRDYRLASVRCADLDDAISTLRAWADWEAIWSFEPVTEPTAKRTARLRRLAAAKFASPTIPVDVDIDPLMLALLDTAQAAAAYAVLEQLFLPGIRWRFPRDKTGGRLATHTQVLLHECAPPAHPNGKGVWLVVDGPTPRTEPRLTVRLGRAVGKAAHHRWDDVIEYWRIGPRSLDDLWGIRPGAPATHLAAVTDALLAGQALDALTMCGISTDRGSQRLLTGLPDRFEFREWTDKWVTAAARLMEGAAPWLWADASAPKQRPRRLENLGGFNPNRRPGLFLEHRDGHPHLSFDQSASPLVLPRERWRRDPDYDLVRLGLLTRDQIPMPQL